MKRLLQPICSFCRLICGGELLGKPIPSLEYTGTMSGFGEITQIIRDKFPDVPYYIPDRRLATCTKEDMERFLEWDSTDHYKYVAEKYDCDDFAWRLKGKISVPPWAWLPFGVVWTNKHALNCFIDDKRRFWFIEPQSDTIQSSLAGWQGTYLRFIAF